MQKAYLLDYDSSMEPNDLNILLQITQMIANGTMTSHLDNKRLASQET